MSLVVGKAINIVSATHLGEYRIGLVFSDRHAVTVDFGPFLRASVNPAIRKYLRQPSFRLFQIVHGNLGWGDYDLCFPIEDLYAGQALSRGHEYPTTAVAETVAEYTVRPVKKTRLER